MKASIKLELFGDNSVQMYRFHREMINMVSPGLGDSTLGKGPGPSSWVAEVTGEDKKYKFVRKFLKAKKDYSNSNSKGSRGVFALYVLESGKIYDIKEQVSWKNHHRYFAKVDESGKIIEVDEQEVIKCLKSQ